MRGRVRGRTGGRVNSGWHRQRQWSRQEQWYGRRAVKAAAKVAAIAVGLVLSSALLFAGGGQESRSIQESPSMGASRLGPVDDGVLRIVGTTTQASDLLRILSKGAENVEITGLMGAGVDPHLYKPTERDMRAMNNADVVIYSGLHLEGQFDTVFRALHERGVVVYALSEPVKSGGFVIGGFDRALSKLGSDDPHFWFDPRNWELSVRGLAALLAEIDPEQAKVYRQNGEAYIEQLELLYAWASEGMPSVPKGQRYIVTSHDAFQYFGAAFGWRMAAIQGISTEDEAGVGDIQQTVDFVIDNRIPVLFIESSIPPGTIQAVIEAIRAEGEEAHLGIRELYSDAMGTPGTFGGTYIGMLAENVYTILQSYRDAGVDVDIPEWPAELDISPPATLFK